MEDWQSELQALKSRLASLETGIAQNLQLIAAAASASDPGASEKKMRPTGDLPQGSDESSPCWRRCRHSIIIAYRAGGSTASPRLHQRCQVHAWVVDGCIKFVDGKSGPGFPPAEPVVECDAFDTAGMEGE